MALVLVTAALAGIAATAVASVVAFGPSEPAFSGVAARTASLPERAVVANQRLLSSSAASPTAAGTGPVTAVPDPSQGTARECRAVRTATAAHGHALGVPGGDSVPSAWHLSGLAGWPAPMRCR